MSWLQSLHTFINQASLAPRMHEAVITRSLINTVLGECEARRIREVRLITVEVGFATSFQKNPIEYYFEFFKKEHLPLASAILHVNMVPGDQIKLRDIEVND